MEPLPLRPNVCLLIRNYSGSFFFGERLGSPGHWQLPQGGVKQNQTVEEAAIEEAHEELGASRDLFKLITILDYTHSYEWDRTPRQYIEKFRGQHQHFALIDFLGVDEDIKIDWCAKGMLSDTTEYTQEFSQWRWCTATEVIYRCAPMRRHGYEGAFETYRNWLANTHT